MIDAPRRIREGERVNYRTLAILGSSIFLGASVAIMWMNAPILPTIIGAGLTGAYLYWRQTKG